MGTTGGPSIMHIRRKWPVSSAVAGLFDARVIVLSSVNDWTPDIHLIGKILYIDDIRALK